MLTIDLFFPSCLSKMRIIRAISEKLKRIKKSAFVLLLMK
ncbi:hypothetical Protein YC6258_02963 [Gynuella sunshinyii YC6258]|uniref:Uncharacterized protein n=1 Tax=Gynuella sunshinyii YC6258 TaxID=1445510 RepID=A0A0C5V6B1_9GAMM|nr:hypothetical Protein YC6258_02963 [Gynuella sunshinyii YC6258]